MNPYRITIEASDPEQLRVNVIALASAYRENNDHADLAPAPAQVTPHTVARRAIPSGAAATISLSQTPEGAATIANDEHVAEISLATVRAHLAKLTQAGKSNEVVAALQTFGCTRLTDVKPEQYRELLTNLGVAHD